MTWEQVFNKLAKEETVHVGPEAVINARLRAKIADVLFYDLEVHYATIDGFEKEVVQTQAELQEIIEREPAFIKCNHCGEIVDYNEGYWADQERGIEYCSIKCLAEEMNRVFGADGWRIIHYKLDKSINLEELLENKSVSNRPVMIFDKMIISDDKEFINQSLEGIGFEIAEKAEENNIIWREYNIEHVVKDTWE